MRVIVDGIEKEATIEQVAAMGRITREDALALRLQELASKRWARQSTGISIELPILGPVSIDTSADSLIQISGAVMEANRTPAYKAFWKCKDGAWKSFNAEAIVSSGAAVRSYIQACFMTEYKHSTAIHALMDVDAILKYDISTGWPLNAR